MFNVLDVLQHRGEDLALAIARVLVYVQIVLLFREKNTRFCWQIMLISLLQVVVATVFQQSIMFAALLLLYVFVGLCAFILLFLQQEHRYFRQHSFVRTFAETIKREMAERQDRRKLARIALTTLFLGPLTLVLTFGKQKTPQDQQSPAGQKERTQEMLRKLFLIFPTEEDLAKKEHWESVGESENAAKTQTLNVPKTQTLNVPKTSVPNDYGELAFHAVPNRPGDNGSAFTYRRFPLLTHRASFSAGTQNPRPWNGNWRELLAHLTAGTCFAFFLAIIIFCLMPRIGRIEFAQFTFKQDFEQWIQPVQNRINVGIVGMSDDIQLGSLGTVIPHHREVIKVRFLKSPDNTLLTWTDGSAHYYQAITGATLYFRGTPLETYSDGAWTQALRPTFTIPTDAGTTDASPTDADPTNILPTNILLGESPPGLTPLRAGTALQQRNQQLAFFEPDCDLVTLVMTVQPLGTQAFFAPHPFFTISKPNEIELRTANGRSEELRPRQRTGTKTIATTAFRRGVQIDLTPCQERIALDTLLQFPESRLDALKALAERWDSASGLPKENIIGRARFMGQQFLQSSNFSYQLGGTIRDFDIDPLEDFIVNNPRGHCEYFAGALTMMLRSVGIGARVVLGFKSEAQDFNAVCTIRQSDAHAWVEVYVPPDAISKRTDERYEAWWQNGGWLRLDPTPDSNNTTMMTALTLQWTDLSRLIQSFWNEYVLNMNSVKQSTLVYEPLGAAGHYFMHSVFNIEFWKKFYSDIMQFYLSFFPDIPQQESERDGYYLLPPLIIIGLLWLVGSRLTSMLRAKRIRISADVRRKITIEFYLRMERILAKIGQIRGAAITPLEFAKQSVYVPLLLPVVDAFYRIRFGNVLLTDEETRLITAVLDRLEQTVEADLTYRGGR